MMDKSAVEAIAQLAERAGASENIAMVDGVEYTPVVMHRVDGPLPEPEPLIVHTLTGLVDYVRANKDELDLATCTVHVVGPDRVDLLSAIEGSYHQRYTFVSARAHDRLSTGGLRFEFGYYMDAEAMVISLQALFDDLGDQAAVLKLLGNLRDEGIRTQADDGVTQEVTVRSGVSIVEQAKVPNPVQLAPYRTFAEVEQPLSPFVLRLRKGDGGVQAALFEADGGAWRGVAIERIAEYLADATEGRVSIIA